MEKVNPKKNVQRNYVTHPCKFCTFTFKTWGNLKRHIESIHEGITYPCKFCIYKAKTMDNLKVHIQSIHEGITYQCKLCKSKVSSKANLKRHTKRFHGGGGGISETSDVKEYIQKKFSDDKKSFCDGKMTKCQYCDYEADTEIQCERH